MDLNKWFLNSNYHVKVLADSTDYPKDTIIRLTGVNTGVVVSFPNTRRTIEIGKKKLKNNASLAQRVGDLSKLSLSMPYVPDSKDLYTMRVLDNLLLHSDYSNCYLILKDSDISFSPSLKSYLKLEPGDRISFFTQVSNSGVPKTFLAIVPSEEVHVGRTINAEGNLPNVSGIISLLKEEFTFLNYTNIPGAPQIKPFVGVDVLAITQNPEFPTYAFFPLYSHPNAKGYYYGHHLVRRSADYNKYIRFVNEIASRATAEEEETEEAVNDF